MGVCLLEVATIQDDGVASALKVEGGNRRLGKEKLQLHWTWIEAGVGHYATFYIWN